MWAGVLWTAFDADMKYLVAQQVFFFVTQFIENGIFWIHRFVYGVEFVPDVVADIIH
jgi:hypothetical protein